MGEVFQQPRFSEVWASEPDPRLQRNINATPVPDPPDPIVRLLWGAAEEYGIDPDIMESMAQAESSMNPNAQHPTTGARGLMQITPIAAKDIGVPYESLFDPEVNARAAGKYLGMLIERFDGDLPKALAAYHAGSGNVRRGELGPRTMEYVQRVLGER